MRIFHECEVQIEKSVRGSLFGITKLCRVMPNSDPAGQIFLSAPINHDGFFFLHTVWSPAFDFNVGVAINESCSKVLMSGILKAYTSMMSTPNVLLYNQCIDNMCCYLFFIYSMGRIRVCNIKFVSTGENCGKPCLVCKKIQTVTCIWSLFRLALFCISLISSTARPTRRFITRIVMTIMKHTNRMYTAAVLWRSAPTKSSP